MSPLSRGFWLGAIDARLAAVFRIGLGLILFLDCLDLAGAREAFFSASGIFPEPVPLDGRWSIFALADAPAAVTGWFAFGAVALAAFTLGLFTRISTVLAWIFLVSLRTRMPWIATGGDYVAQNLIFWSLFTDLGATWSLDAWRRKQSRATAPALGWRLMLVHVALLYFVTGRLKVRFGWLEGDGIYQALIINGFARPPGAWLAQHPQLCQLLTYGVIGLELGFPLLAFFPWKSVHARLGALLVNLALQVGILFTMKVGLFTPLMMWCSLLLIPDAWAARIRFQPPAVVEPVPLKGTPVFAALASFGLVLMAWDAFIGSRVPMPAALRSVQRLSAMEQPFELFGKGLGVSDWSGAGIREDGTQLDVIDELAPGLASHVGWRFSVWFKLVFNEKHLQWPAVGDWLCRQHDARGGPRLVSLVVKKSAYQPVVGVAPDPKETVLLDHRCAR